MKKLFENIMNKKPIIEYITTGDDFLDKKILGYQKGELITIASRPGFGKTSLALKSVIDNIKKGKKVFYVILGESSEIIITKILSQMLDVNIKDILLGNYSEIESLELQNAIDIISEYLILEEALFMDIEYLFNKIDLNSDFELVVIDSMEYLKSLNDNEKIVKSLKEAAYLNQMPILLLTTININVEKRIEKRPMLYDISNAQDISEYSDKVLVIYSDDFYKEKIEAKKERIAKNKGENYKSRFINKPVIEKEIIILKSRFGIDGVIKREFKKQTAVFVIKKEKESIIDIVFDNY